MAEIGLHRAAPPPSVRPRTDGWTACGAFKIESRVRVVPIEKRGDDTLEGKNELPCNRIATQPPPPPLVCLAQNIYKYFYIILQYRYTAVKRQADRSNRFRDDRDRPSRTRKSFSTLFNPNLLQLANGPSAVELRRLSIAI